MPLWRLRNAIQAINAHTHNVTKCNAQQQQHNFTSSFEMVLDKEPYLSVHRKSSRYRWYLHLWRGFDRCAASGLWLFSGMFSHLVWCILRGIHSFVLQGLLRFGGQYMRIMRLWCSPETGRAGKTDGDSDGSGSSSAAGHRGGSRAPWTTSLART